MEELGARKYDLNRPIYDLNRYEQIFYTLKESHNMVKGNLIHLACAEMKWELVLEMLKIKGVDVNAISTDRGTFFMSAAQEGVTKIIQELLLNPGIDPNMKNRAKDTAFSLACCSGQLEVVKILLSDPRVEPESLSFYSACYKGNLKVVELLLSDSRINPNESNQWEETALFEACDHNEVDLVKLLLSDSRIDPSECSDRENWTCFNLACANGHSEIVKLLLKDARTDLNCANDCGMVPFSSACEHGRLDVVKLLLNDPRLDLNLESEELDTPFYTACIDKYQLKVVELFLALSSRKTMVYEAVENKLQECLEIEGMPEKTKTLLQAYAVDENSRKKIGEELYAKHFGPQESALIFAGIVFLCDDYLAIKKSQEMLEWQRFLKIAQWLPMELQMVLVNRAVGLGRDSILKKNSEPAFRDLVKLFA